MSYLSTTTLKWVGKIAILSLMILTLYTIATAQTPSQTIYACANNSSGTIHIVSASDSCKGNETLLSWNSEGPAGPAGLQGIPGPVGPEGAAGSQGPEGPAGSQGSAGPDGAQGLAGADGAQGPSGFSGLNFFSSGQGNYHISYNSNNYVNQPFVFEVTDDDAALYITAVAQTWQTTNTLYDFETATVRLVLCYVAPGGQFSEVGTRVHYDIQDAPGGRPISLNGSVTNISPGTYKIGICGYYTASNSFVQPIVESYTINVLTIITD